VRTRRDAERVELELKRQRSLGELYVERPTTLGQEIDALLNRLRASGGRSPRTIEFYERGARVWEPFRSKSVAALGERPSRTSSRREQPRIRGREGTSLSS
jgi:hypothetical protein